MKLKLEADLGDSGVDVGDALDAIIKQFSQVRDACWSNDDPDKVQRYGEIEGERGNFDGELVGHWEILKR